MMRARTILVGLVVLAAACGSKGPSPTPSTAPPNTVIFTAALSPANEVPPITNAEQSGSGTATITLNLTRDSAGAITAATVTFQINLTGFPAGTSLTAAHIHEGASTCACPVKVNTSLANGELVLGNGSGAFVKAAIATPADVAQGMITNPSGYYFNVHSTVNGGGFARGILVKQ